MFSTPRHGKVREVRRGPEATFFTFFRGSVRERSRFGTLQDVFPDPSGPPGLPHVSGSKTLVTLCPEKNVNLAHTYTLVGGSRNGHPEGPDWPGIGSGSGWFRDMVSTPKVGVRIRVRRVSGTGSRVQFADPGSTPRMTIPGSRICDPRSQDR